MNPPDSAERPGAHGAVPTSHRILGPDLARGFMLLLIAMAYAGVYAGVGFGGHAADSSPPDRAAMVFTVLFLDNRAFPMFAILYGYGMSWMLARQMGAGTPEADSRRLLRRRSLFLMLFGAVHAVLVFPGEILMSYGVAGLVSGWLLFRSDRTLVRAIAVLVPLYAVTVSLGMVGMAAAGDAATGAAAVPGYLTAADWANRLGAMVFNPLFIGLVYPLFLLVVIGYWAGRRRYLDDPAAHRTALSRIAAVGIGASVLGALPSLLISLGVLQAGDLSTGAWNALQVMTGVLGGAGYAALFGLISIRLARSRGPLTRSVAAVGRRSLTFYLLNSVLVALVLHPDLGGLGSRVGGAGALAVAFAVWAAGAGLAAWLEHTGRKGPMDALLRRLVYR